jgi:hypothetical protein
MARCDALALLLLTLVPSFSPPFFHFPYPVCPPLPPPPVLCKLVQPALVCTRPAALPPVVGTPTTLALFFMVPVHTHTRVPVARTESFAIFQLYERDRECCLLVLNSVTSTPAQQDMGVEQKKNPGHIDWAHRIADCQNLQEVVCLD